MKKLVIICLLAALLLMGLVFVWTTTASAPTTLKLLSAESGNSGEVLTDTPLTAIIFSSEKIYCYSNDIHAGKETSISGDNSFRKYLLQFKKENGDSTVVLIKPTTSASYQTIVDVLDEMTMSNIQKYALLELTEAEKKKFGTDSKLSSPPAVQVQSPRTTTVESAKKEELLIEIQPGRKIDFFFIDRDRNKSKLDIENHDQNSIEKVIEKAKKLAGNKLPTVVIKAGSNLPYSEFSILIKALNAKEIHNYQLITIPE